MPDPEMTGRAMPDPDLPKAAEVRIVPAGPTDRAVIDRLMQLCLYDAAAETPFSIGDDGRYGYDLLDVFWHSPWLIRSDDALAGFALVVPDCPITGRRPCWFMAEFFVLRDQRGKGVGRRAVQAILARHPGPWHVATHGQNPGAARFWDRVLPLRDAPDRTARHDGMDWTVRSLSVAGAG